MNSSKVLAGLWMMNSVHRSRRCCHRGGLSLMIISNFFRVVSAGAAGFMAPYSIGGAMQSLRRHSNVVDRGFLSFSKQQKVWLTTVRESDSNDNSEGGGEESRKSSKNPFRDVSVNGGESDSGANGDDSDASPSTRNRLLKQKKVNLGSSWMERNDAFAQGEDAAPPPPRRFDSSSSQDDRRTRSEFGGERRRSDSGGGDRRRNDFGGGGGGGGADRRRNDFGGDRRRNDFGGGGGDHRFGGERRQGGSSSFRGRRDDQEGGGRPFRRWDNQEEGDRPREWSSDRGGGGGGGGGGRRGDNSRSDGDRSSRSFRQDFRGTRVFVQGLGPDTTWQQLKDHFRVAGEVVFASVSIDARTGESKGHGIVQFESTEMAFNAINIMREHPLDGETLYVRADVQESRNDQSDGLSMSTRSRSNSVSSERPAYGSPSSSSAAAGTPSSWRCADEETVELIPEEDQRIIKGLIKSRDAARRQRDYDASDDLRAELKTRFGVHLDDRLKMWWVSLDGKEIPTSIREAKGDGRWGKAQAWRQIPTTPENDACVNADLVNALLTQRDIARKEKDFTTADRLLQQARTSPDGDLELRIHDESRTWRIWTDEPPPRPFAERRTRPSPAEQCIELVREHAPHKEDEIRMVLEKFQGREYKVLKKLQQRYLRNDDEDDDEEEADEQQQEEQVDDEAEAQEEGEIVNEANDDEEYEEVEANDEEYEAQDESIDAQEEIENNQSEEPEGDDEGVAQVPKASD